MTIRIDEASLLRAGFPRDLVAALRDLATLSASSVTPADLNALQIQITANDAELAAFEEMTAAVNRKDCGLSGIRQKLDELELQIAAAKRPATPLPTPTITPGGGNSILVSVDFGASFTDRASTVVTGETWVGTALAAEILTPSGVDTDEMYLLGMSAVISSVVAGDGFTVTLYSQAEAKGVYQVMVIGV